MASTVFIRIHKDNSVDLFLPGDEGILLSSKTGDSERITESCRGNRPIVFIPTSDVHLSTRMIPARNRQKILQAVPFSMEDDLIGDVRDFHFAIPARLHSQDVPVCAIARARLDAILDQLDEYRLHTQVMIPEVLLLPCQADQWNIIIEAADATIQTGPYTGYSVDTGNLEAYLEMALQQAGEQPPARLNIIDTRLDAHETFLEQEEFHGVSLAHTSADNGLLPLLASHYRDDSGINLLQGDYTPRRIAGQSYKKWVPAISLLAIILLVQGIAALTHYLDIDTESDMLDKQIRQVFQQSVPDVKRMVDPRSQMQQRLTALKNSSQGSGAGFLPILSRFSQAMQGSHSINLKGMNYRNGRLDLELTIGDLQALETLKQSMTQAGLKVDIRSATVQGKAVFARLRIQEVG